MKFAVALGWMLFLLVLPEVARAEGAKSGADGLRVVMLRAGELDWEEASRSVEAELAATGFRVLKRQSAAKTPGQLIDELRSATKEVPHVHGSVAVFEEGGMGRAYVWIPERENLFQVDVPPNSGRMAAEVLSLRVVELLRVRLLDEPPRPPPEPEPERGLAAVWVIAGPLLSASARPPLQLGLGTSIAPLPSLVIDVSGQLSVIRGTASTEVGSVSFTSTQLSAHALWNATGDSGFTLAIGAGGGLLVFDASGSSNTAFVGRSASANLPWLSLRARAGLRFGNLGLLLLAEPGVTLPRVASTAAGREVFSFGQPIVLLGAGLAWSQ